MPKMTIDDIDIEILHHLQNDARISNAELAEKIGMSPSPCLRRVKALENKGVIKRYAGIVDAPSVGLPISCVINITLQHQDRKALAAFEEKIASYPEIMECYLMTGNYDYLLRIVVPDLESYERFLADQLTRVPGVANIQSSFALKQLVYRTELPLARKNNS